MKLGFRGRPGTVRKWAEGRRKAEPRTHMKSTGITGQLPANCQLAKLLMTDGDVLPKAERGPRRPPAERRSRCGGRNHRGQAAERLTPPEDVRKSDTDPRRGDRHAR